MGKYKCSCGPCRQQKKKACKSKHHHQGCGCKKCHSSCSSSSSSYCVTSCDPCHRPSPPVYYHPDYPPQCAPPCPRPCERPCERPCREKKCPPPPYFYLPDTTQPRAPATGLYVNQYSNMLEQIQAVLANQQGPVVCQR